MTDKVLSNFVDKHLGKRIFIFGTGPGLNDVTPEQLAHIEENEISIGVNFTPFHVTPTYWVAGGHATYTAFAIEHLSDKTTGIFHHDPGARSMYPSSEKIVYTDDSIAPDHGNPIPPDKIPSTLIGGHNILLSASHLAYILGAFEIVYIGFSQVNRLHFYNLWSEERQEELKSKLRNLAEKYKDNASIVECVNEMLNIDEDDEQRWCHFKPVDVCKNLSFKKEGKAHHNYPIFKNYVDQFKGEAIRVLTTATEGICVDAGAGIVKLEDIIGVGK